ncbi:hypothetical protein [Dyella lutea]|uniref:Uncharacterized protein n=1 Tax=Dyella lutea TaxID=2950441 RepID=A0ABT1FDB4_9GAMM|nr:hypothetical protein [Dyella lutea]MCP1375368.1 hypothetical protein [Dyella lutea]
MPALLSYDLFPHEPIPRAKPRVMMHVIDAGVGLALFQCARCGHESDWVPYGSLSDAKRGMPCPHCNPEQAQG